MSKNHLGNFQSDTMHSNWTTLPTRKVYIVGAFIFFSYLLVGIIGKKYKVYSDLASNPVTYMMRHHPVILFPFFFSFFFPSNLQVTTGALGEIVLFNFGKFIVYVGVISKFGAGSFLLVQVLLLLDATHSWNDSWVAKDEQKWYFPPPK